MLILDVELFSSFSGRNLNNQMDLKTTQVNIQLYLVNVIWISEWTYRGLEFIVLLIFEGSNIRGISEKLIWRINTLIRGQWSFQYSFFLLENAFLWHLVSRIKSTPTIDETSCGKFCIYIYKDMVHFDLSLKKNKQNVH